MVLSGYSVSLGNTARVLGNQKIDREQKEIPVEPIQSVTCIPSENYQKSTQFYQQASACYRQAELNSSSITKIQAQLNLLSLLIQMQQWTQVPNLIEIIQSELTDLPFSRTLVSAQLKLAQKHSIRLKIWEINKRQAQLSLLRSPEYQHPFYWISDRQN